MAFFGRGRSTLLILLLILSLASLTRFYGIGFGLPALRDPDEPMFVLAGLKLLRNHTLNPAWFGHPGTTTIYCLALLEMMVFVVGHALGRFASAEAFAAAIYHDPSILFFPGRILMALCGIACVWLTFVLGRRLAGDRVGLVAAALLAMSPLHIAYSQLIRTDIQASVFATGAMIFAVHAGQTGRLRAFLFSAVCAGFAIATKWPAAFCLISPLGAGVYRMMTHPDERSRLPYYMVATVAVTMTSLFVASPFLLLDYPKLLADLHGEARPRHLGATGAGPIGNLVWYGGTVLPRAMGIPAVIAAVAGIFVAARWNRLMLAILLPGSMVFLLVISSQKLVWARWMLTLLPVLSILAAMAICRLPDLLRELGWRRGALSVFALSILLLLVPMALTVRAEAIERQHDTRDLASAWARKNIPAGSTVLVEQFAFDLLPQGWRLLFPLGAAGCLDVDGLLGSRIQYSRIETLRQGQPIVDIGTVAADKLPTCKADYAILSDYDRYRAEASEYRPELENYRKLITGGQQKVMFSAVPGRIGGPTIRIVRLSPQRPAVAVSDSQSE